MAENKAKQPPKGWVKISEFERLTGLQRKTIANAIKTGKIAKQYSKLTGNGATSPHYINPKPAAICWYKNLSATHHLSKPLRDTLAKYIRTYDPEAIGEKPGKAPKTKKEKAPTTDASLADAQLRERVAKAELAELDLKRRIGSLVEREKIESQLFAAGKELRDALLVIPDRIIDQVIASADNRHQAHRIIYDAIAGTLEKLTDINARINR